MGGRHPKSCCRETLAWKDRALRGTLKNVILKQKVGACLQIISLMKTKLLPLPLQLTLFTSAQGRREVPSPESAFKSVIDRAHTVTALVTECRFLGPLTPEFRSLEASPKKPHFSLLSR